MKSDIYCNLYILAIEISFTMVKGFLSFDKKKFDSVGNLIRLTTNFTDYCFCGVGLY